ncbi:DNA-damage-inducible protein D [Rhodococcus sp. 27YEA15]|uniref:phage antirepressor KilAC domain-containing protein n=1 Tax=Rhodococcus sp. 27YEA15 TaxID=3156259 RepID=UPI003C7DC310
MSELDLFSHIESPFDSIRQVRPDGPEFWSARDLMPLLGYDKWERFTGSIDRAIATAQNSGQQSGFSRLRENLPGGTKPREDFRLSRFACYLVAMNGDPRKPEVAAAQAYFAIRTREAEATPKPAQLSRLDLIEIARAAEVERLALEAKVSELAPKAEYVDTFVTDADLLSFRTVASTLETPESELRKILIEHGWIYVETATRWSESQQKKETINRYSEYSNKKSYFRRIEEHKAPRFRGEVMHTLKITPPGAQAIAKAVSRWVAGDQEAA